ncbi:MAG: hypothetical protein C4527_27525 [Candidatus Omnitrophota bacterium]|jgi:hypothetical protein|nr:MAG: hypothetical protein C4527_27525 [Candidatus Omnitrophota bacterium]
MFKKITLALCLICLLFSFSNADFKAGVSYRIVTPDPLLPVSGGIGPSHPTTMKKGELTVRALVLENEETRVAIVSGDFLGFPAVLGNKVRTKIKDIPPENILIGVTHTHSAPDCYGFPNEKGEVLVNFDYLDMVCTKMAEAINEAANSLQRVFVKIGTDKAEGKIAYNYYADRLYDPRCHVMQFVDVNQQAIATLVNYAIHPEVLGADQGILSPDLIGPLYDRIAANGGGIGVFMNSAQGGMVTADCRGSDGKDIQTWEECIRIGALLADEALRIAQNAAVQENPKLSCFSTTITFPIESPIMRQILQVSSLQYQLDDNGNISTQVNMINLGNAQILTIPGEALPNIGYYLKRKMKGEHNFLFGLTNDAFGYMLTKVDFDSFDRYRYITRTSLGEMTGEIFIEEALQFIDRLPLPKKNEK